MEKMFEDFDIYTSNESDAVVAYCGVWQQWQNIDGKSFTKQDK